MTYKEFQSKFWTRDIVKTQFIVNGGPETIELDAMKCKAGFGDLVKAYIGHVTKPWYKKNFDHDLVEKRLVTILNASNIEWFER